MVPVRNHPWYHHRTGLKAYCKEHAESVYLKHIEANEGQKSTIFKEVKEMLRSFFAKEEGQGLVEYALILVLIAIVVIGILTLLGKKVSQVFSQINSGLTT